MSYHATAVDLNELRAWRLGRVREQLSIKGYGAILLFDPINIRYALDAKNMQVWTMHNRVKYAFIPAEGKTVLFDFSGCEHLSKGNPSVGEIRSAKSATYLTSGSDLEADTADWADEIADLMKTVGAHERIALDVCDPHMVNALRRKGLQIENGTEVMEHARWIKNSVEVAAMQESIDACEEGIRRMHQALIPGITENALASILHQSNIELGGEWIETRLLTSGRKTKPWFQESTDKLIQVGEMVSFDTDSIGPNGYCADISRSWICGGGKGTSEQRDAYKIAYEQLQFNLELMRPGRSLRDISQGAFKLPSRCDETFYSMIAHGVGLCDEAPLIRHAWSLSATGRDNIVVEPGMVFCVESLVALNTGFECVKLEDQILITEKGMEILSSAPFELDLLT
ncbi:Xaa-Pro dipeptidase [Pseudomonas sp. 2725]|uniref:M24 family metallopeptidase n=1 Tax=Pseudomonas sp. 2725 TaxID=3156449 RepID=UPI003D225780